MRCRRLISRPCRKLSLGYLASMSAHRLIESLSQIFRRVFQRHGPSRLIVRMAIRCGPVPAKTGLIGQELGTHRDDIPFLRRWAMQCNPWLPPTEGLPAISTETVQIHAQLFSHSVPGVFGLPGDYNDVIGLTRRHLSPLSAVAEQNMLQTWIMVASITSVRQSSEIECVGPNAANRAFP
jgi:hypothetical protein